MIETPFATTFDNYEGIFGGITQLMSFVLSKFYQLTGSYGWAILLLTLVVKLMLLPLYKTDTFYGSNATIATRDEALTRKVCK